MIKMHQKNNQAPDKYFLHFWTKTSFQSSFILEVMLTAYKAQEKQNCIL